MSQYIGFVEDRLSKAGRALEEAEPALRAASKFLYHAMHKLSQLRSIAAGDVRPNPSRTPVFRLSSMIVPLDALRLLPT